MEDKLGKEISYDSRIQITYSIGMVLYGTLQFSVYDTLDVPRTIINWLYVKFIPQNLISPFLLTFSSFPKVLFLSNFRNYYHN